MSISNISRIAINSRSSAVREDESTFTGDMVLRFKHIPSCEVSYIKGMFNNIIGASLSKPHTNQYYEKIAVIMYVCM